MVVERVEELSASWFTGCLREAGVLDGGTVTEVAAAPFGTGQFGVVAKAELEYDGAPPDAPRTVIVKLPSPDEGVRAFAAMIGAYEGEVRFYTELASTLDVPVPHCYWGQAEQGTHRFTLLLEDLSDDGAPGDIMAGGTVDQAAAAMASLASLHSSRWDDAELRTTEWLTSPAKIESLFNAAAPSLPAFLERFGPMLSDDHASALERVVPRAVDWVSRWLSARTVIVHGDFRLDNLWYRPRPDDPRAIVFDWQAVKLGPPMIDAALYLGSCLTREQRLEHERPLLQEYHQRLVAGGISGWSLEDCWESYRWCAFNGMLIIVPAALGLLQTERGDRMLAAMFAAYADMVDDLASEQLLA